MLSRDPSLCVHRDHMPLRERKILAARVLVWFSFSVEQLRTVHDLLAGNAFDHVNACAQSLLDRADEIQQLKDDVTFGEFLDHVVGKIDDEANLAEPVRVALSGLRSAARSMACVDCIASLPYDATPCADSQYINKRVVALGARCLSPFTKLFDDAISCINVVVAPFTGGAAGRSTPVIRICFRLRPLNCDWDTDIPSIPISRQVSGKTMLEEPPDHNGRAAIVLFDANAEMIGLDGYLASFYVFMHELGVHAVEQAFRAQPRESNTADYDFSEGFVDAAVFDHTLCAIEHDQVRDWQNREGIISQALNACTTMHNARRTGVVEVWSRRQRQRNIRLTSKEVEQRARGNKVYKELTRILEEYTDYETIDMVRFAMRLNCHDLSEDERADLIKDALTALDAIRFDESGQYAKELAGACVAYMETGDLQPLVACMRLSHVQ